MEVGALNQPTKEELSSANQTRLLEDMEDMLETMRAVNLTAAYTAASKELRYVSHGQTIFLSSYIKISCLTGLRSLSLSLFSLAESLVHSLHAYFLSSRVTVADMLHHLSTSLTVGMETLQHLHTQLSTAARWNTRAQALVDDAHTLLHTFQVTS